MEQNLIQYGIAGIVLAWLMFRVEKRLDKQAKNLELLIRQQTVLVLSLPELRKAARDDTSAILGELQEDAATK